MLENLRDSNNPSIGLLTRISKGSLNTIMIGAILMWLLPLLGLIINSLRPFTTATSSGWWTVLTNPEFTLDNYRTALSQDELFSGFTNSVLITVPTTFLVVTVAAAAAFALIWTTLPGRKWMYTFIVALIVVPPEITLYPSLVILKELKLVNTYPGIWMSHLASAMPFGVFLLGSFFSQIPRELMEAAKIDGANTRHLLLRIVLPLSGSALASLATFDFLWVWNDLLRALIIIPDPSMRPLTAVLANSAGGYGEYITVQAAGATLLMLPPLIVFLMAQRAFIRGVLAGAMKA
jgi:alpha-glucoside transport system permease protein